ncbi:MAG TPA: hypothetical protein VF836_06665, partial [Gemmatimonadaceae bacterium]
MRFIFTLCAVALMTPAAGFSQMSAPAQARVDAGSRVRIAAPVFGTEKQIGTVVSVTRDTLVLRQGASTNNRSVATSDITTMEVSWEQHTHKAKGAIWGLLIGAGGGAIAGYASYSEPKSCADFSCIGSIFGPSSKGSSALLGGVLGGIVGTVV